MMKNYNSLKEGFISTFSKIANNKGILSMLFVLFSCISALGQVTVNSTTGTSTTASYTTLASAITAINDGTTHTGAILCEVIAGHTETAPIGGFAITASGSAGNTIIFTKSGTGANPSFTASGSLVSGALTDAIFKIIGGDYITLDGFTMLENDANATTAAATNNMTEFGVALFYATATNGCQNVTIKNCTIDLTRTYQNTFGIYANSTHSATIATTTASATSATGGNSNLLITGNTITDVNQGISVVGPIANADHNDGLVIGGATAGVGNTITNFGATGTFSGFANVSGTVNGILVRNVKNYIISNNSVTSAVGLNTAGTLRGIFVAAFNNAPTGSFTNAIDNNIIDIKSGVLAGAISGIVSEATTASATASISVNNNTFNGLSHTIAAATGTLIFIQQVGPYGSVTVSNNTFNSLTANTTGTVTFISASYTMPTATSTQTYNNNTITGGFNKTGAGGSVVGYTSSASSVAGSLSTATGNNFSGITVTGATAITGWTTLDGGAPTKNLFGNTFTNWTGGTSTLTGIIFNYGATGGSVSNNVINNLTGGGSIVGINFGSSNSGASQSVTGNTITNLTSTGIGTGININGLSIGASTVVNLAANNNTINTFSNASSTGQVLGIISSAGVGSTVSISNHNIFGLSASGVTPLIAGVAIIGTTGTVNLYANKVHSLIASGATTNNGAVNGISLQGALNVNCYNNIVGGLTNPLGSAINAIIGIQVQSTVAASTYNVYNNSVFLNATSTGTNFGTTGLFHSANATATIGALDMTNNIIINQSLANGSGLTTAFRRTLASYANFLASSNRNLLFAGTPSATNVIFNDGTTSFQTITDYKNAAMPRDGVSFTKEGAFAFETPGSYFISLTGSNSDFLKPVSGITTQAESGGLSFSSLFTTDFAGIIRAGNVGYMGTGTSPDLGAFEFAGTTPSPIITLTSITPAATTLCVTAPRLVSVIVNPSSGTTASVLLNYSFNGTAQPPVTMTNTAGNTWEGSIPASVPANALVTWSVLAANTVPITSVYNGTGYADEPLLGLEGSATASNTIICPAEATILTANLSGAVPSLYATPPAISNPTTDEDLANVTISSGATVILNNSTPRNSLVGSIGTASGVAGSYSNFTAFGPYALTAGQTYNFSVGSIQDVTAYGNSMAIYIDYNRNGVFTDAGEKVYAATATILGTHTETGSFIVPVGAFNGLTRMRVILNEGLITSPTQAISYGEYEEYAINITSAVNGGGQVPAFTVSWSDGTTTVGTGILTVNPSVTTTYTAIITSSGCDLTPAPTVLVTVNPAPTAPVATASTQCGAQIPTAFVTDPNAFVTPIFTWYADNVTTTALQTGTFTTYQSSISATSTFYVSVKNPTTLCESVRTPVGVTVTAPQAITLSTAATISSCLGSSTTVVASSVNPGYTYSWTASPVSGSGISGTSNGASQTFTPTALGTYTYTVTGTDGICTATATVSITINVVPDALVLTPISNCVNAISALTAAGGTINNFTIVSENFNGATNSWTTSNNSTGGTPANIAWTLTNSPYTYATYGTFISNDASQFYLSNSDAGGSGSNANTALTSPVFSTINFVDAKVSFWHYLRTAATAKVEYSLDGGVTWTTVQVFNTTTGAPGAFVQENIVLPAAALNQANVQVRFKYDTVGWQYFWAVDNVVIAGTQDTNIVWSPVTNLYTDAAATISYTGTNATTVYVKSATAASQIYTATATAPASGCSSIATVNVTTNANTSNTTTVTVCDTYTWAENGVTYTTSGTYTNVTGCNTETLVLTINALPVATVTRSGDTLTIAEAGATYQWVLCDGSSTPIPGEVGQSYVATAAGSYAVIVTKNGCSVTSDCFAITTLSNNSFDLTKLSFYPNPVIDMFTVTYAGTISSIQVYDISGRLVRNISASANEVTVDMSDLAASVYIVKVAADNTSGEFKVIKK